LAVGQVALAAAVAFFVPFAVALGLSEAARRLSPKLGFLDRPGGHKAHEKAVPLRSSSLARRAWLHEATPCGSSSPPASY